MLSGSGRGRVDPGGGHGRSLWAVVLVVLATFSFLAASAGYWADRSLLTTDEWVERVGPLASDPAVQSALTDVLTDQLMAVLRPAELLEDRLPAASHPLIPGMVGELRVALEAQVAAVLASPQFESIWVEANRAAHGAAVRLVRGEPGVVVGPGEEDGVVVLNLMPVVNEALRRFAAETPLLDADLVRFATGFDDPEVARAALEERLGIRLEERFGSIEVFDDERLAFAQRGVALFDRAFEVSVLLTVVLVVGALVVSRRRRRTAIQLLVGAALVTGLLGLGAAVLGEAVTGLVDRADRRAALEAVVDAFLQPALTTMTWQFAVMVLAAGALLVVGAVGRRDAGSAWNS